MRIKTKVARKQSRPNFPKNGHIFYFLPLILTGTCSCHGLKNVRFFAKICHALFSCYLRFEIRLFAFLPTNCMKLILTHLTLSIIILKMVKHTSKLLFCKNRKTFKVCLAIFLVLCTKKLRPTFPS